MCAGQETPIESEIDTFWETALRIPRGESILLPQAPLKPHMFSTPSLFLHVHSPFSEVTSDGWMSDVGPES